MDLFVYQNTTTLTGGFPIQGYTSVTWVERWNTPGEFKIEAPLSANLQTILPLGSIIGKIQAYELMIVENVEVEDDPDTEAKVTISGRSFIAILEQRVIGFNVGFAGAEYQSMTSLNLGGYAYSDDRVQRLITLMKWYFTNSDDVNNNWSQLLFRSFCPAIPDYTGFTFTYFKPENLLTAVLDYVNTLGIGIKSVRRNKFLGTETSLDSSGAHTEIDLYVGKNVSNAVQFTPYARDIERANYLRTNKNYKTSILVQGRWHSLMLHGSETAYDRRITIVSATDIDQEYDTSPGLPPDVTGEYIQYLMLSRARDVLARSRELLLASAEAGKNGQYRYRRDYNIGDIVLLEAPYGDNMLMRVVEYAEIEDENGESGLPTLSVID